MLDRKSIPRVPLGILSACVLVHHDGGRTTARNALQGPSLVMRTSGGDPGDFTCPSCPQHVHAQTTRRNPRKTHEGLQLQYTFFLLTSRPPLKDAPGHSYYYSSSSSAPHTVQLLLKRIVQSKQGGNEATM